MRKADLSYNWGIAKRREEKQSTSRIRMIQFFFVVEEAISACMKRL